MGRLADRAKRRSQAQALMASRRAEMRYASDLRKILQGVHAEFEHALRHRTDSARTAESGTLDILEMATVERAKARVGPAFDRMASDVKRANARGLEAFGIPVRDHRLDAEIAHARNENIRLVEEAGRVYAKQVREIFESPDSFGVRVEELKKELLKRADVSESRAELIARDQTLKLNGQITKIRQTNAGVEKYRWSTSGDDRVRPEHAALEGEVFDWNSPPSVGHPGQDFQCRCTAIPVAEDLDEGLEWS